jgi:cell division protein FtsW (lipid II flippase)
VAGLVWWVIVGGVVLMTRDLPLWTEGSPGPRFMPLALAVVLAILNVLYWADSWRRRPANDKLPQLAQLLRPACFVALIVALVLLWERLGALLTVLLCALVEFRFLEGYPWPKAILVSLALGALTIGLFQILLGVALPGGVLEFVSYLRL